MHHYKVQNAGEGGGGDTNNRKMFYLQQGSNNEMQHGQNLHTNNTFLIISRDKDDVGNL